MSKDKTYKSYATCTNCYNSIGVDIPFEESAYFFIPSITCPNCGLKHLAQDKEMITNRL